MTCRVRGPDSAPTTALRGQPVSNMDLVATVLEAAGAERPEPCDSRSLMPLLRDPGTARQEDLICEHHGHGTPCFQRLLRRGRYKYVAHLDDLDELYDLQADPYEGCNLVEDPQMGHLLEEMRERLARRMGTQEDTAPAALKLRRQMGERPL